MGEVRTRLAGPDDALVVAALTLQCALHRGGAAEPGFLDRYARAWSATQRHHPVWLAEAGDEHAGYLQAAVVEPLPVAGRARGRRRCWSSTRSSSGPTTAGSASESCCCAPRCDWARDEGFADVRMSAGRPHAAMVERVGFVADDAAYRLEL